MIKQKVIQMFVSEQATIHIPRGQQVTEPIDLRMHDAASITIILEPSSSATVFCGSIAEISNTTINRTIHFIVHEHASLTFEYHEEWHDTMQVVTDLVVEQKESSAVYYRHFVRGGAQVKQTFSLIVNGNNAQADIRGVYDIKGDGMVDMKTLQYHDAAHTQSNLLFKGVGRDAAQLMHHGTIVITKNGAHTESAQHTHTLLLGDKARAISVPTIEVSTHEVQCGHGSAIGRLDEEQVWYLQARGLSREQAEQHLIDGFLNQAL